MKNKKHLCFWNSEELPKWQKLFKKLNDLELCLQKGLFVKPEIAAIMKKNICSNPSSKFLKICEQKIEIVDYLKLTIEFPEQIMFKLINYFDKFFKKEIAERNISFDSELFGNIIQIKDYKIHYSKEKFQTINIPKFVSGENSYYVVSGHNHPYSYLKIYRPQIVNPDKVGTAHSLIFLSGDDIYCAYDVYDRLQEDYNIELDFWIEIIFTQIKRNNISDKMFEDIKSTTKVFCYQTEKHNFIICAIIIPFKIYDSEQQYLSAAYNQSFALSIIVI